MRVVQGVSFPRSGHHFLVKCLCEYFAAEMPCYEFNRKKVINHQTGKESVWNYLPTYRRGNVFVYCEFYGHRMCRSHPCKHPNVKFQKSHDFFLEDVVSDKHYYLVQLREPLAALVSYYQHRVKTGIYKTDCRENWELHCRGASAYYRDFRRKWVDPGERENLIIVDYKDLMSDTEKTLNRALEFLCHESPIDHDRIRSIATNACETRDITSFKYYDPSSFAEIRSWCMD